MRHLLSYQKRGVILALIILFLFLGSVAAICFQHYCTDSPQGMLATITQKGVQKYSIDLSQVTEPYKLSLAGDNQENIILVEHNRISMVSASCKDNLCVKMGAISSPSYLPIVCLPNEVVISCQPVTNVEDIDAVTY